MSGIYLHFKYLFIVFDCSGSFFSCLEWGLLFSCNIRAFHCGDIFFCGVQSLGLKGFSSCGMWDFLGPGIKPMFPALASRFLTTGPPGKYMSGI